MKRFFLLFLSLLFCAGTLHAAPLRGAWIATVQNIDWPSSPSLGAEAQQKELSDMLDGLKKLGINNIFLQVRPSADTFWLSELEPWSKYLSGAQGKNPGYDPLKFAVDEAHRRGLKIHAWVNPFRAALDAKAPLSKNHPAVKNKSWAVKYDNKIFYDPGNPAARAHSIKVITEIAFKYKVDGIHLDDYFYPYPDAKKNAFNDNASFKKYAKESQKLDDWRRENINTFIKDLRAEIKAANPALEFGISPFGIWCNAKDCEGGSNTGGFNSNLVLYSDSRAWLRQGLVDYIAPQLYWQQGHKTAPFNKLADWWAKQVKAAPNKPKLYIGVAAYKHTAGDFKDKKELGNQLKYSGKKADGVIYFSAGKILSGKRGISKIIMDNK
jgi:uncharacterized lipoprotein YddW (UPF0748 family)